MSVVSTKTVNIMRDVILYKAKEMDVLPQDLQIFILTDREDSEAEFLLKHNYQDVCKMEFVDMVKMHTKVDLIGIANLAPPYMKSILKNMAEENGLSEKEFAIAIIPTGPDLKFKYCIGNRLTGQYITREDGKTRVLQIDEIIDF